jgi:hypothetical protein
VEAEVKEAHRLSPAAQEVLRLRVIVALEPRQVVVVAIPLGRVVGEGEVTPMTRLISVSISAHRRCSLTDPDVRVGPGSAHRRADPPVHRPKSTGRVLDGDLLQESERNGALTACSNRHAGSLQHARSESLKFIDFSPACWQRQREPQQM